jgi:glycosyltransferase involved in cell wall biosynthesis
LNTNNTICIAIIVPALRPLGPIKVMQTLVDTLSETRDLRLKVFYINKTIDPEVKFSAPVERLNRSAFPFAKYDIVHTNGICPDLFARINRKKIRYHISTIHNFVFEDLEYTYNKFIATFFGNIWLLLWRRADKLVCVSETMRSYYKKWFPLSKMEIIYNGIGDFGNNLNPDSDIIDAVSDFRIRKLNIIGSAGILTKRKGIDIILNLIAINKQYAFILLGDGKEFKKLKQLAEVLNISDRCHFCGFRFNAIIYFKYFDYFIFPSRSEGFGLALIEAIQQRVPVICSDIEVFRELFSNEEVVFFNLDNLTSLQTALNEASEIGDKKTDLAYSRYLQKYTGTLMAKRYSELYQNGS